MFSDWNQHYEKITDMIVPRSSVLICQDAEYGLYTVSLFKKVQDEFKLHAREKKFVVREFTYNEEELAAGKHEITKLVTDKKKQFVSLKKNRVTAAILFKIQNSGCLYSRRFLNLYFIYVLITGSSSKMVESQLQ